MTEMTEITERLHLERDALPAGDVEVGLRNVRHIARRRRRRNSLVGAAAASGLLVVGIGATSVIDSGSTEIVVTDTASAVTVESEVSAPPTTSRSVPPATTSTLVPRPTVPAPTGPVVGEAVTGRSVESNLQPVTVEFRTAVGEDFETAWQVPWNDGFLVGGTNLTDNSPAAFFSPDGRSWESVPFDPGIVGEQHNVMVADGRLAMIGFVSAPGWPRPVVASTTDLANWSTEEIPVDAPRTDLPDIIRVSTSTRNFSANADGWIAVIDTSVQLEWLALAEQQTGNTITGGSEERSDDGITLTAHLDAAGTEFDDIFVSWTELEEEIGIELTAALRGPDSVEVWSGTWEGEAPVRSEDADDIVLLSSLSPIVALDSGFAMIRTTTEFPDDAPPVDSTELFADVDGDGWSILDTPIPDEVRYAFPLDGDLGVVAVADDDTVSIYRVDVVNETWTPIDVPGLPETASYVATSRSAVLDIDAAPEQPIDYGPYSEVVEKDGYRLTTEYELYTSSYELVAIDTGEVVVAETIDLREVEGSFKTAYEYLSGGLGLSNTVVVDPDTGEVLIDVSAEERAAANPQEPIFQPDPEPWIAATDDGVSWFVYELPPRDPEQDSFFEEQMVVSGGRLLYSNAAREWFVIDLI